MCFILLEANTLVERVSFLSELNLRIREIINQVLSRTGTFYKAVLYSAHTNLITEKANRAIGPQHYLLGVVEPY